MKMAHIGFTAGKNKWGGAQTVVYEYIKNFQKRGHHVQCIFTSFQNDSEIEEIDDVKIQPANTNRPNFGIEKDIQIVHFHRTRKEQIPFLRYCKHKKIPYVVTVHALERSYRKDNVGLLKKIYLKIRLKLRSTNRFWKGASAVICINPKTLGFVQKNYPQIQSTFIPNGVDIDRFSKGNGLIFREKYGISKDAKIILNVNRVTPEKDQLLTLHIFKRLKEREAKSYLILLGQIESHDYYKKVMQEIQNLQLQSSVIHIEGFSFMDSMLVNAYHAADAFLKPNLYEEWGLVTLEAWCARLPVVACRNNSEHFQEGISLLYNSDDEESAVEHLYNVLSKPEFAHEIGERGYREVCEKYSWNKIAEQHIVLYKNILSKNL